MNAQNTMDRTYEYRGSFKENKIYKEAYIYNPKVSFENIYRTQELTEQGQRSKVKCQKLDQQKTRNCGDL